MVGSTSPTSGTSSIAQTFTAPAGSSQVGFWYQGHCPNAARREYATATLRDNTTSTSKTMLSRTCTNTGAWVHVTTSVTAGHQYTLTLSSRDDNQPADPAYALYDDVIVQ
jgi:serine protease